MNIFMVPMDGPDHAPEMFSMEKWLPRAPTFHVSRDMRYVAYLSAESGQREIYVRPYPGPGGQVTVSVGGGREPMWIDNGDRFYRSLNGDRMFTVSAPTAPTLTVGRP